jgi:hypothetical protein
MSETGNHAVSHLLACWPASASAGCSPRCVAAGLSVPSLHLLGVPGALRHMGRLVQHTMCIRVPHGKARRCDAIAVAMGRAHAGAGARLRAGGSRAGPGALAGVAEHVFRLSRCGRTSRWAKCVDWAPYGLLVECVCMNWKGHKVTQLKDTKVTPGQQREAAIFKLITVAVE